MRIPIYIVVNESNIRCCGESCPFLYHNICKLFNEDLREHELKEDWVWQDGVIPWHDRCDICYYNFDE